MVDRQVVVVDVETTGLDPDRHSVVEVAWWNLNTHKRGRFVPVHRWQDVVVEASLDALRVNGYFDRIAEAARDTDGAGARLLRDQLHGNTLAGANPAFDAAFLLRMYRAYGDALSYDPPQWHHRLLDLSAYAAGVLGLSPGALPGLSSVCEALGVTNPAPHTAEGDVSATGRCFGELIRRRSVLAMAESGSVR